MKRVTQLFLGLLVCAGPVGAQDPVGRVDVDVRGPQSEFRCAADWEETRVKVPVAAGERQLLSIPILGRRGPLAALGGEVRALGSGEGVQVVQESLTWPGEWTALPRSLQSRALPPVESAPVRIDASLWAGLVMTLLIVLAVRRRPVAALLLGSGLGLVLFYLPKSTGAIVPIVRVLEGEAGSGRWLEVHAAQDRLDLDQLHPGWLLRLPTNAPLLAEVLAESEHAWSLCAADTRLYFSREIALSDPPSSTGSGAFQFRRTWLRTPGQGWSEHGPWTAAVDLPPALEVGSNPPGWLAAGLPQGVPVLVGSLEPEGDSAAWLRLVGFGG